MVLGDVEHVFMCILAICIAYLEKCLFRSFVHFFSLALLLNQSSFLKKYFNIHFISVAAQKLFHVSCSLFDKTWVPDQGSNPGPLNWEHEVFATGLPGKSLEFFTYSGH